MLFIIFLVVPIIEIYVLIQVGEVIGALPTILFVVATAVIGIRLLKMEGLSTMARAQQKLQSGTLPADEMTEGIALIIAGAFLLTPGFFTDFIGFLLLIPPTRKMLITLFAEKVITQMKQRNAHFYSNFSQTSQYSDTKPTKKSDDIIEGVKYHRDDD